MIGKKDVFWPSAERNFDQNVFRFFAQGAKNRNTHRIELLSGILATGPRPGAKYNYADASPAVLERVSCIAAVCERYAIPLNVAALRFPIAHPTVTSLVVGAATPAEVQANVAALQLPIPAALWTTLRDEGLIDPAAPLPE